VIPDLDPLTGYLPYVSDDPYTTTIQEVHDRFATNDRRRRVWDMFELWVEALDDVGLRGPLRLSGSYVTGKEMPGDLDVAVYVSPSDYVLAEKVTTSAAHLWTWHSLARFQPSSGWVSLGDTRIQPALGLVDAFWVPEGPHGRLFAQGWTSEFVNKVATGVRKGWLEVER